MRRIARSGCGRLDVEAARSMLPSRLLELSSAFSFSGTFVSIQALMYSLFVDPSARYIGGSIGSVVAPFDEMAAGRPVTRFPYYYLYSTPLHLLIVPIFSLFNCGKTSHGVIHCSLSRFLFSKTATHQSWERCTSTSVQSLQQVTMGAIEEVVASKPYGIGVSLLRF